jgi:hypothetical protein
MIGRVAPRFARNWGMPVLHRVIAMLFGIMALIWPVIDGVDIRETVTNNKPSIRQNILTNDDE